MRNRKKDNVLPVNSHYDWDDIFMNGLKTKKNILI